MINIKKFNESTSDKNRCLYVSGGDFSALSFRQKYNGTKVSDIIDNLSEYENDEWDLVVYNFGNVDDKFIEFIHREIQDYDQRKDQDFFFEWEILKK